MRRLWCDAAVGLALCLTFLLLGWPDVRDGGDQFGSEVPRW